MEKFEYIHRFALKEWKKGGCWILQFMKKDHDHLMDKRWESLLIACIGEEIGVMAVIGVVLSLRSNKNQMEVWLSTTREDIKIKVGERLRVLLDLDPHHLTLFFKENAKSLEVIIFLHIYCIYIYSCIYFVGRRRNHWS